MHHCLRTIDQKTCFGAGLTRHRDVRLWATHAGARIEPTALVHAFKPLGFEGDLKEYLQAEKLDDCSHFDTCH
jgi:hypothetical protein